MHYEALFLHTGWRSAGTWIWQRFREQPNVMAFCEPLNEWLAEATAETLHEPRPEIWPSRHPAMRPYFSEYAPLVTSRGIAGYDRKFAYDQFFASPSEPMPALERYLRRLCDLAEANAKLPVLKFTRSLGRVEWMRRYFPQAAHIVVLRSPLAQYRSAAKLHAQGHRDFLTLPIALLAYSQRRPLIADVLQRLECDLRPLRARTLRRTQLAVEHFIAQGLPDELYRAMLAFWVTTTLTSIPFADVVVDAGNLHESAAYRRQIEDQMAALSGVAVSLESAARPASDEIAALAPSHETVRRLHRAAQGLLATFITPREVEYELLEKLA
jgi:hypothetical protein